jgi:hypothetical protein
MSFDNDPYGLVLIILILALGFGFLLGSQFNRQRRSKILNWIEPQLRQLGGQPGVQGISRTVFRIHLEKPRPPSQHVTTTILLMSREFFPLWVWEKVHGLNDILIFHYTLHETPKMEMELVDPSSRFGQAGLQQTADLGWREGDIAGGYQLRFSQDSSADDARRLAQFIAAGGLPINRLALRRSAPHILLNLPSPILAADSAQSLAKLLKMLPVETLRS